MLECMFPRVKLERKTAPMQCVAVNFETIEGLADPFKTNEGIQTCITFKSVLSNLSSQSRKSSELEIVVLVKTIRIFEMFEMER